MVYRYIGYLIGLGRYSFKGLKIGLDCANGSAWNIAKNVFDAMGAKTYLINAEPDGYNINTNALLRCLEAGKKYDIEVKGHEVELYIEDVRSGAVANGIYSLLKDKWVKEPIRTEYMYFDVLSIQDLHHPALCPFVAEDSLLFL